MADVVARLTVTDGERASLEWRLWTGSRRPTQDLYVQPRSGTYPLKVSLHNDGYAQLGFLKPARDRLRDTEQAGAHPLALAAGCAVVSRPPTEDPPSELQVARLTNDTRRISAANPDETTCIHVFVGDGSGGPTPAPRGGWADAVTLKRQTDTVFVGVAHRPFAPASLNLAAGAPAWELPDGVRHQLPYGHMFGYDGDLGCATVTEYSTQQHPSTSIVTVPSWSGPVRGLRSAAPDLRRDAVEAA